MYLYACMDVYMHACMQGLYLDKQLVKVQESPNDIPEGETPLGVSAYAYNELVDVCRPGDRVAITGERKQMARDIGQRSQ